MAYQVERSPIQTLQSLGVYALRRAVASLNGRVRPQELRVSPSAPHLVEEQKAGSFHIQVVSIDENTVLAVDLTWGRADFQKAYQLAKRRESMISVEHIILPFGPVQGKYKFGYPHQIRFAFYTSDGSENFGKEEFENRFPGHPPFFNRTFGGGLYIRDNEIHLGSQDELAEAVGIGLPAAQLMYSWEKANAESLMGQIWTHKNINQRVGSSLSGNWCWYLQFGGRTMFVATKIDHYKNAQYQLQQVNEVNNLLAGEKPWKAGLTAFGLSGGFIIRVPGEGIYSNHPNPEIFHTLPAYLVVRKQAI